MSFLKFLRDPTYYVNKGRILEDPISIIYMGVVSEDLQLLAIKNSNAVAFKYIENPTPAVVKLAVELRPENIVHHAKLQTDHIQINALENNLDLFSVIDNPSLAVQKYLLKRLVEYYPPPRVMFVPRLKYHLSNHKSLDAELLLLRYMVNLNAGHALIFNTAKDLLTVEWGEDSKMMADDKMTIFKLSQ